MRRAAGLAVVLAALSGCAGTATEAEDAARAAGATFVQLCAAGAGERLLPVLTAPARRVVLEAGSPREGCARVARLAPATPLELERLFRDARVVSVSVHGDTGTVAIAFPGGRRAELDAEATGTTRWLLTNSPLPG
jgi:hypothetical protein